MSHWKSQIDIGLPCWRGYRNLLGRLGAEVFPATFALNQLLPREVFSRSGAAVRFVPADSLPGVQYEQHIFETGEVSTRENNWHDLFNALVWCRLPRLKTAMNSLHYQNLDREKDGCRGKLRDALTLIDESGVIVAGSNLAALEALAKRDWNAAFVTHRAAWRSELQVLICGHAVLEKFLQPYKAVTAHALFVHSSAPVSVENLDLLLATSLADGQLVNSTKGLSPLPLVGIPGWWPSGEQDQTFYSDLDVFRPPPERVVPAPVHLLGNPAFLNDPGHFTSPLLRAE